MIDFIDISSWQGDIDLSPLPIDAVIVKATQDIDYVNPYCDSKVQQAISLGLLWGFYHFAGDSNPRLEADYFIENCENYFKHGIPVLDWEGNQSVEWVNIFVNRVHERTGVWCWIYANPWRFNQGGVEPNCARWVASYPPVSHPGFEYDGETPYANGNVVAWQYCSDGRIAGFDGDLDLNHYYGNAESWRKYAMVVESPKGEIYIDKPGCNNGCCPCCHCKG